MIKLCIIHIFMTNISKVMICIGTVCYSQNFSLITSRVKSLLYAIKLASCLILHHF